MASFKVRSEHDDCKSRPDLKLPNKSTEQLLLECSNLTFKYVRFSGRFPLSMQDLESGKPKKFHLPVFLAILYIILQSISIIWQIINTILVSQTYRGSSTSFIGFSAYIVPHILTLIANTVQLITRRKTITFWRTLIHFTEKLTAFSTEKSYSQFQNSFEKSIKSYFTYVVVATILFMIIHFILEIISRIIQTQEELFSSPISLALFSVILSSNRFICFYPHMFFIRTFTVCFDTLNDTMCDLISQQTTVENGGDKKKSLIGRRYFVFEEKIIIYLNLRSELQDLVGQFNLLSGLDFLVILCFCGLEILLSVFELITTASENAALVIICFIMGFVHCNFFWHFCLFGTILSKSAVNVVKRLEKIPLHGLSDDIKFKVRVFGLYKSKRIFFYKMFSHANFFNQMKLTCLNAIMDPLEVGNTFISFTTRLFTSVWL